MKKIAMRKSDSARGMLRAFVVVGAMAAAVFMQMACGVAKGSSDVSYEEAHGYFFRNDAVMPASPLISTQEAFDSLFGAAATMGKNGMPTEIDFEKQSAVAVVLPETNVLTDISIAGIVRNGSGLGLKYSVRRGEKMSYTIRPVAIVVVEGKYKPSDVTLIEE